MKRLCFLLVLFSITITAAAQQNGLLTVDSPANEYIKKLQHHGYLLELNPTALPYTKGKVYEQLQQIDKDELAPNEQWWIQLLQDYVKPTSGDQEVRYGIDFEAGTYVGNSQRKSALRPLGDDLYGYPNSAVGGYLENEHFIANLNVRHDLYYDRDPDGIDSAHRLYVRSEDAYLGYNSDWLSIYAGRFKHHWAPFGETSSILSDNANSFDQLNIRFGNEYLSLRSVIGELDNISTNDVFTGRSYGNNAKKRYLVAHRLDWRPTTTFGISLFESVIYSGAKSGFSLKYANPLHTYTFVTDNAPKNDENNLQIGGMLWFQKQGFTVNGQLMIDDFQVKDNLEKHTFTITSSLYKAKAFSNVGIGFEFEAVSYQTYNPTQPEGRYLYLKRGLATQFNDYILGAIYADIYPHRVIEGLTLTPKVELLLQGEQTINQPLVFTYPDGTPIDYILTGDEEQTLRPSLSFRFQRSKSIWVEGNVGINFVKDVSHQVGIDDHRFAGFLKLGIALDVLKK